MKKLTIAFVIFFVSCTSFNKKLHSSTKEIDPSKGYKILKIDSVNNIYLIYAQKEDSLFKILSLKESPEECNHIEAGQYYSLKLNSMFPRKFLGQHDLSPQALPYVDGIDFHGTKILIEKDSIMDLHTAENIKGLCFIKDNK